MQCVGSPALPHNVRMASLLNAVRTAFSAFSKAYKSTPSSGERQMANMFAAPWAYPGTWSGEKIAQVEAYRGWVAVCVRFLSHKIGTVPTACYVNQGGERLKWQSRVKAWHAGKGEQPEHRKWVSKVRQKSLTGPIKEDEDVEYLDDDHPLIRLINDPNEPDVGSDFWPYFTMFRFLCGESYIWKVRKGKPDPEASGRDRGDVVEMWVLPSPWVTPRPGRDRLIDHYEVRPYTTGSTGGPVILHRDDVIRWSEKSPIHPLGSYGQTQSAAAAIDVYQMLETARYNGLNNGGDPGSVWILPEGVSNVSPEVMRDLASRFQGRYAGVRNAGVPLVLPGGSTFVPRDGQVEVAYAQSLDQMRDYVMAHYGLDKSLMGFSDSSTYAASVIGMQRLKHQVIAPEQMQLAQLLTERLAVEFDDDIAIVFQEGPTLIDPDERRANWQLAISHPAGPCVTKNEVRVELLGKEPIDDDPNADILFYQPGLIKSEDLEAVAGGDMGPMLGEGASGSLLDAGREAEDQMTDLERSLLGGKQARPWHTKGKSGIYRDSAGRRYRLQNGVRVAVGDSESPGDSGESDAAASLSEVINQKIDGELKGVDPKIAKVIKDKISDRIDESVETLRDAIVSSTEDKITNLETKLESRIEDLQSSLDEETFQDEWKQNYIDSGKYIKDKYDYVEDDPEFKAMVQSLYEQQIKTSDEDKLKQAYEAEIEGQDKEDVPPFESYVASLAVGGDLEGYFAEQQAERAWQTQGKRVFAKKTETINKKVEQLKADHESKVNSLRSQIDAELEKAIQKKVAPKIAEYANNLITAAKNQSQNGKHLGATRSKGKTGIYRSH